jgi:uncharacterized membrane protein YvbJ
MRYYEDSGYFCPQCGRKYEDKHERGDKLVDEYASNPMIGRRKGKKKEGREDFPKHSQILSDLEYNPVDGTTREIEH